MISSFLVVALAAPPVTAPPTQAPPPIVTAEPVDVRQLRAVPDMTRAQVAQARADGLPARIAAQLAGAGPIADRLLAARALARLGTAPAVSALSAVVVQTATPEEIALAREAARALKQLRAREALAPALASPDPEVRALAAAAGAAGEVLCQMLATDPWPMVRIAAAQGLAGAGASCLSAGLSDAHERVAIASARAAIDTPAPALRPALRRLAASPKAATEARAHAFVALAALGDLEPASAALKTHLDSGTIEPLALAAVRAFGVARDTAKLTEALGSARPTVVKAAARALLVDGRAEGRAAVQAAADGADPRLANVLRRLMLDMAPVIEADDDPAALDPE